jgi:hypothetical protein
VYVIRDVKFIKNYQEYSLLWAQTGFKTPYKILADPEKERLLSGITDRLELVNEKEVWTIIELLQDAKVLNT